MAPNDIREKLDRKPFQPIRVHVSDGSTYEIEDRGDTYITRMELAVGLDHDETGLATRTVYLDPRHVTRIESRLSSGAAS